jgi:hypothetical protein
MSDERSLITFIILFTIALLMPFEVQHKHSSSLVICPGNVNLKRSYKMALTAHHYIQWNLKNYSSKLSLQK